MFESNCKQDAPQCILKTGDTLFRKHCARGDPEVREVTWQELISRLCSQSSPPALPAAGSTQFSLGSFDSPGFAVSFNPEQHLCLGSS